MQAALLRLRRMRKWLQVVAAFPSAHAWMNSWGRAWARGALRCCVQAGNERLTRLSRIAERLLQVPKLGNMSALMAMLTTVYSVREVAAKR